MIGKYKDSKITTSPFKGQDAAFNFVKGFKSASDAINSANISLKAMRADVAGLETGLGWFKRIL